MDFIKGKSLDQVTFSTLESRIEENNPVRFVDAFEEQLDLAQPGFVGYNHTNLKGLIKVNGEMALIMTVCNIRRCITILGIPVLLEKLKNRKPDYKRILFYFAKTNQFKFFRAARNSNYYLAA